MKLSFIIPAYNEEQSIGSVIYELKEEFNNCEIIVVDDGSKDNTYQNAQGADLIKQHKVNKGLGESISTGIKNATGDFCIIVDADGQHKVSQIKKVVKEIDESLDAVFTQRTKLISSGLLKGLGKLILVAVIWFFTRKKFRDINSGLVALKRNTVINYLNILPSRYSFSTAILILANLLKLNVRYVDIEIEKRKAGKSKVRLKDFLTALFIILSMVIMFEPLNFFVPFSLYSFYLGIISGAVSFFLGPKSNPIGFTHFFTFSIFMFIMGLVSYQISTVIKRLYREDK
jgi:glycosyltransferase involved in cell wall biosynthesis